MARGNSSRLSPEVEAIFERLRILLDSDAEQNKVMPETFRAQILHGLACDELPNAHGEFGRTPTNPIPTNGPLGEVLYLSRLRVDPGWRRIWADGSPLMFHRLGTTEGDSGMVDVYEVISLDGTVRERLFLSMYHPRKSRKVPRGYKYASKLDSSNMTYGVNHFVENFPEKLDAYIRKWQISMLGVSLPVHRVRERINGSRFIPSVLDDEL